MAKTFHKESIKCPNCGYNQMGKVEHTLPFYTYIHNCDNCRYCITESEWNKIEEKEVKQ